MRCNIVNNELIATTLSHGNLNRLRYNEIAAIWIKEFYSPPLCELSIKNIINSPQMSFYTESTGFKRIGLPYSLAYEGNAQGNSSMVENYFNNSVDTITHVRELFNPYHSPLDSLRLKLDELWPGGAYVKTVNQQKYLAGVIRLMQTPEVDISPHFDRYLPLYSNLDKPYRVQLSANIYLKMPSKNGDLKLWLKSPSKVITPEQVNKLAVFSDEELGLPKITMHPAQGDLIIFNPCLLHSVGRGIEGTRISLGLFLGLNGDSDPIEYWS